MADDPRHLVRAGGDREAFTRCFKHPHNPNAEIHMTPLSEAAGLTRAHLWLSRVPPGRESFVYHCHNAQEEYVYILSGRGTAEIGDQRYEVGPGDFMGFPTDGVGHHLINSGDEDLVYLMGGERTPLEIGNFPRLDKRILFESTDGNPANVKVTMIDDAAGTATSMGLTDFLSGGDSDSPSAVPAPSRSPRTSGTAVRSEVHEREQ